MGIRYDNNKFSCFVKSDSEGNGKMLHGIFNFYQTERGDFVVCLNNCTIHLSLGQVLNIATFGDDKISEQFEKFCSEYGFDAEKFYNFYRKGQN